MEMELIIGQRTLRSGEQDLEIPVAPVIAGDRTYLPARFVAEAAGYAVDWVEESVGVWTTSAGLPPGRRRLRTAWSVYYSGRNEPDEKYLRSLHRAGFRVVSNLPGCQGHSGLDPELVQRCACRTVDGSVVYLDVGTETLKIAFLCQNNPEWRERVKSMLVERIDGGADAVMIDETGGVGGAIYLGACFCRYCMQGFRDYLANRFTAGDLMARFAIADISQFDYGKYLKAAGVSIGWHDPNHPLYLEYMQFLYGRQRDFIAELVDLAHERSGGNALVAGNVYGMRPMYQPLADLLDFSIFELSIGRPPETRNAGVYLLARAVLGKKPFSGFPDVNDLAGLSPQDGSLWRHWLAEALACGGSLMMPYQAFTSGAGEYTLPDEAVSGYVRFARAYGDVYQARDPYANVAVLSDFRTSLLEWDVWLSYLATTAALVEAHVPFSVLVQGDGDLLKGSVAPEELSQFAAVIIPPRHQLGGAAGAVEQYQAQGGKLISPSAATAGIIAGALSASGVVSVVQTDAPRTVGVLPMSGNMGPAVHLVNYDYDAPAGRFRACGPFDVILAVPEKANLSGFSLVLVSPDDPEGSAPTGGFLSGRNCCVEAYIAEW